MKIQPEYKSYKNDETAEEMYERWNKFVDKYRSRQTDFSGMDLSDFNLIGYDFSHCSFRDSSLSFSDLSDADLFRADLTNANLIGAVLERATLCGATLDGAKVYPNDIGGRKGAYILCVLDDEEWEWVQQKRKREEESFKLCHYRIEIDPRFARQAR